MVRPSTIPDQIIRSRQNTRLKELRLRLLRGGNCVDDLIAIEGEHLVREALHSGLRVESLFLREDRLTSFAWAGTSNTMILAVAAEAFNYACATEAPQGIAAIVEAPRWSFDALLQDNTPRLVVLAGLQDPGNVGTVIRTAEAFGASGVLLTPQSVHPWNQKVLRASAGSSFRLPVILLDTIEPLRKLRKHGVPLYACAADAGDSILDKDLYGPWAFVIGNEGAGIADDIREVCSSGLHIPCPGRVESLNAGVAASILLYEAARQRGTTHVEATV